MSQSQLEELNKLLSQPQRLRKAHEYKEEFREIYENSETVESGKERFTKWLEKASLVYGQVITTITNHLDSICNYFLLIKLSQNPGTLKNLSPQSLESQLDTNS